MLAKMMHSGFFVHEQLDVDNRFITASNKIIWKISFVDGPYTYAE